jgi:hypothetical protein
VDDGKVNVGFTALVALGSLVLVAASLLWIAGLMTRWFPRLFRSRVWAALHLLAVIASLTMVFVVVTVHRHTGEPLGPRDLLAILICPAMVYGAIVFLWLKGFAAAATMSLISFFIRGRSGDGREQ